MPVTTRRTNRATRPGASQRAAFLMLYLPKGLTIGQARIMAARAIIQSNPIPAPAVCDVQLTELDKLHPVNLEKR